MNESILSDPIKAEAISADRGSAGCPPAEPKSVELAGVAGQENREATRRSGQIKANAEEAEQEVAKPPADPPSLRYGVASQIKATQLFAHGVGRLSMNGSKARHAELGWEH